MSLDYSRFGHLTYNTCMPRPIVIAALILSLAFSGCAASQATDSPSTLIAPSAPLQVKSAATPTLTPARSISQLSTPTNPFGLLLGGENMTDQLRVDLAKALGVTYFRPWYTTIADWNGACLDPACDLARAAGLKLILTVRNNAVMGGTTAADDLVAYRKTLGKILDTYQPEVLVVENEESSPTSWAGTPDQYAVQLKAACDVAHQKNIQCTNGGLDSQTVGLLVWADLIEHGSMTEACDFVQHASTELPVDLCRLTAIDQLFPAYQAQIARGRQLIGLYPSSGQDYLNFHWYVPDQSAFAAAVAYLQRATQLPLMSNELGQRDQLPDSVNTLLSAAIDRQLRYAVWFSLDRGSQALQDANGALRPTGEAFSNFMQAHYQSTTALPAVTPAPTVVAEVPEPVATLPSFTAKPIPAAPSGDLAFSQTLNDVTYCTAEDGTDLKMDLYFPIKPAGPAPVVMFVHGGGWVSGTKADIPGLSYFLQLARRGYLIASIDYRLAPKYKFPANIEDVKCAVRSLRAHAKQWNLDPKRIGAWGDSAGDRHQR